MRKLEAVEIARELMTKGSEWGTWRWLLEKPRVRQAADRATEALAAANAKVKSAWSDDFKSAYGALVGEAALGRHRKAKSNRETAPADPKFLVAAKSVKEADDEAERAVAEAESLFAEAERRMSADLARQAARKALESYDLREKAIREAEAARRLQT
jgi:hypothetical protein